MGSGADKIPHAWRKILACWRPLAFYSNSESLGILPSKNSCLYVYHILCPIRKIVNLKGRKKTEIAEKRRMSPRRVPRRRGLPVFCMRSSACIPSAPFAIKKSGHTRETTHRLTSDFSFNESTSFLIIHSLFFIPMNLFCLPFTNSVSRYNLSPDWLTINDPNPRPYTLSNAILNSVIWPSISS